MPPRGESCLTAKTAHAWRPRPPYLPADRAGGSGLCGGARARGLGPGLTRTPLSLNPTVSVSLTVSVPSSLSLPLCSHTLPLGSTLCPEPLPCGPTAQDSVRPWALVLGAFLPGGCRERPRSSCSSTSRLPAWVPRCGCRGSRDRTCALGPPTACGPGPAAGQDSGPRGGRADTGRWMGRCLGPPVGVICAQSPPTPTGKLGVPARCPCAPRSGGHGSGPLGGGREGGRPASSTLQLGREACQAGRPAAPERVPWGWAGAGAMPAPWCSGARPQAPPSLHLGHSQVHAGPAVSCPAPGHCPPALQTPCGGVRPRRGTQSGSAPRLHEPGPHDGPPWASASPSAAGGPCHPPSEMPGLSLPCPPTGAWSPVMVTSAAHASHFSSAPDPREARGAGQ